VDPAEHEPLLEELCSRYPQQAGALREMHGLLAKYGRLSGAGDSAANGNLGRIGPYRIVDVLGEGGMGTVYLAEQEEPIRRQVALKVIKPG